MVSYNKRSLFYGFLLLLPFFSYAQKGDREKVAKVIAYCDSLRKHLYEAGRGMHDTSMREAILKTLPLIPAGDLKDSAILLNYAGFAFAHEDDVNPDSVIRYYNASLSCARQIGDASLIAKNCNDLIHIEFEMREPVKAEKYKNLLQSITDTTKDKDILRTAYPALGSYYQGLSYYSTAQDYLLKGILIREQQLDTAKDQRSWADYARQCYTLAQLYFKTDMPDKSLDMLRRGRPYVNKDIVVGIRYSASLIQVFCRLGQVDSALDMLYRVINPMEVHFHTSVHVPAEIIFSNVAIVRYYLQHGGYARALPLLQNIDTLTARSKEPFEVYEYQRTMGKYHLLTGRYDKAIPLLELALPVAAMLNRENYAEILKDLAAAQKGAGNTAASLQYYEKYVQTTDSLTKQKLSTTFADQETRYQTNQKEQRINSLDKDNRLKALELQNGRNVRILLIVGLVVVGLFALTLFFFYRKLSVTNDQLALANDTKARLFGIISHDLRSPVSRIVQLLQVQKERPDMMDDPTRRRHEEKLTLASESVLETMEDLLLWSKSQMQHFTPQPFPVVLSGVLEKEISLFHQSLEEKQLELDNRVSTSLTCTTDENFLSVIVRNLLQNAVKYSSPGGVITVSADERHLYISNSSSGAKADELNHRLQNKQVDSKVSGLGLQIAADLAASIQARISFRQEAQLLTATLSW